MLLPNSGNSAREREWIRMFMENYPELDIYIEEGELFARPMQ